MARIADQVTRIIVEHLGVDAHAVVPEALFRDDLGADSLDAFELLLAFEDAFGLEIPDTDAGPMREDAAGDSRMPARGPRDDGVRERGEER